MGSETRRKVLVVDDSPTILQVVKTVLTQQGYDVTVAASGEEGLRLARDHAPDVVLLDVMMPGMDGYTLVTKLQQERRVPVVVLSATTQAELGDLFLGRADGWLEKPFRPAELVAAVGKVLKPARGSDGVTLEA
jgi:CheY-like chemotaxis protein